MKEDFDKYYISENVFPEVVDLNKWVNLFLDYENMSYYNLTPTESAKTRLFDVRRIGMFKSYLTWLDFAEGNRRRQQISFIYPTENSLIILPNKISRFPTQAIAEVASQIGQRLLTLDFYQTEKIPYVNPNISVEIGLDDDAIARSEFSVGPADRLTGNLTARWCNWQEVEKKSRQKEDDEFEFGEHNYDERIMLFLPEDPRFLSQVQIRIVPSDESRIMNHESR